MHKGFQNRTLWICIGNFIHKKTKNTCISVLDNLNFFKSFLYPPTTSKGPQGIKICELK